jgi:alanine dehydrogenase
MTKVETLVLTERETEEVGLGWTEAISVVEDVFRAHGLGRVVVPAKVSLDTGITGEFQSGGNAMPAFLDHLKISGLKWITWNWDNAKHGLPSVMATLVLNDPLTGAPLAIMGGAWITAIRTGAVTAVAFKYLGRPGAENLAVIGAGKQGFYQVEAMSNVMKIKQATVYDIRPEASERLAKQLGEKVGFNIEASPSVKEAVADADVVVTVTTANEPLVRAQWLKEKGTLLCSLGSYQEFDFVSVKRAHKIVVDHTEQTLHRGELAKWVQRGMLDANDIYAELGEIVAGKKPGRVSSEENIFCVPIGMGCDDVAVAHRIWQAAKSRNVGRTVNWL